MPITQAADFTYSKYVVSANAPILNTGGAYVLNIDGTIMKGDYNKFKDLLSKISTLATTDFNEAKRKNTEEYKKWVKKYGAQEGAARITLYLNSLGGDVVEAIKIGRAVRDLLLNTHTGLDTSSADFKELKCMSACFFIWISGVDRRASPGDKTLGIHRLYFEKNHYKGLTSKQAEIKYKNLKNKAVTFLKEMGVSEKYADKMFAVPSNDVYILSEKEVDDLEGMVPYYEELLFSRCGAFTKHEKKDYMECVVRKVNSKKCSSMSPEYLSYIESKIEVTQECWRVHKSIERWGRINGFF